MGKKGSSAKEENKRLRGKLKGADSAQGGEIKCMRGKTCEGEIKDHGGK